MALPAEVAHHLLRVLRHDGTEAVTYTDGLGTVGSGTLSGPMIERGAESAVSPPPVRLTLAVAPPADRDRLRFLVEKAAELEVCRLVWLRTRFGNSRLPGFEKLNAWAQSGLEQSRGAWLMEVSPEMVDLTDLPTSDLMVADVSGQPFLAAAQSLTVAVGPEGGWAEGEWPDAHARVGLGRTILRTETAAIVVAALCRFPAAAIKRAND